MKLERRWLILPALLVTIALCEVAYHAHGGARSHGPQTGSTPSLAAEPAALDVGAEATSNPIRLATGQRLRVHLPASPATGYGWQLVETPPAFLLMETDPGLGAIDSLRPRSGTASDNTWTFRAQKRGRAYLRYDYRTQLESASAPPVRVAVFDIEVK